MALRTTTPPRKRKTRAHTPARSSRQPRTSARTLIDLLDDKVEEYTVNDWRKRNLRLADMLAEMKLIDPTIVSKEAHRVLTDLLIHVMNAAATDPQNAGHVRAQNENILHYGITARLSTRSLSIALEAGFIHDLNKAMGEPLRRDDFGVRDQRGRLVPMMTTMAQIVGLNHLGDRTRSAIEAAARLPKGALAPEIARAIDMCIIHHGLGSSKFIQDLMEGRNAWWGDEFVDHETKTRKLVHPSQPPLTLESVIHDLADSTQQMQGGAAWLMKYPAGFWRASGRSLANMLSGRGQAKDEDIPMSLRLQIDVETATCKGIIEDARRREIVSDDLAARLERAVKDATASSVEWIDDSPDYLANKTGESVYHDVAHSLRIAPEQAKKKLELAIAGRPESAELEPIVWESGRRVDLDRAKALAAVILNGRN
jgi:hypothetical protein